MQLSTDDMAIVFSEYLLPMCPIISQKYCYIGEPDTVLVSKAKKRSGNTRIKASVFPYSLSSSATIIKPDGNGISVSSFYFDQSPIFPSNASIEGNDNTLLHGLVFYCSFSEKEYAFAPFVSQRAEVQDNIINYLYPVWKEIVFILSKMEKYNNDLRRRFYIQSICSMAITIALSSHLMSDKNNDASSIITKVIFELVKWASKTYEGTRIPFGFIITKDNSSGSGEDYTNFLKTKNSALFTDGVFSAIKLNAKGEIKEYIPLISTETPDNKGWLPLCPSRFAGFSKECTGADTGIVALSNGDIMLFQKNELVFTRRSGKWGAWRSEYFIATIPENMVINSLLMKTIYISLLNASFAHCGACFAIIAENKISAVRTLIGDGMLDEISRNAEIEQKKEIIRELIVDRSDKDCKPLPFERLNEKLRTELMSLDGAFVIDTKGNVMTAGAILSVKPGSNEGGRSAAAKELSTCGIGVKVSEDGEISVFVNGKAVLKYS